MKAIQRYPKKMIVSAGFAVLFVFLVIPFELVVSPERSLTFVDSDGKSIAHAEVRQVWQQYSLGESGEERLSTDSDGKVYLPKHSINTKIILLLTGALREFSSVGIHASYGSSEHVMIKINNKIIKSYYDGQGLQNERVIISQ